MNIQWDIDRENMVLFIIDNKTGERIELSCHEIIETIGRKRVMEHIKHCDNSRTKLSCWDK